MLLLPSSPPPLTVLELLLLLRRDDDGRSSLDGGVDDDAADVVAEHDVVVLERRVVVLLAVLLPPPLPVLPAADLALLMGCCSGLGDAGGVVATVLAVPSLCKDLSQKVVAALVVQVVLMLPPLGGCWCRLRILGSGDGIMWTGTDDDDDDC